MQKSVYNLVIILAFLGMLPLTAASIVVDPLQAVYNIGDDMALGFVITRTNSANTFLVADLECAEGKSEIYKTPLRSSAGEQKKISIPAKLDRFIVGNLSKDCTVLIVYGNESGRSTGFEISSEASVLATLREIIIQPGSSVSITGSAAKKNGKAVEGILDAAILGLNVSVSTPVKGGVFNLTLPVPARAGAQTYLITLHAYESDDSGLSNEGKTTLSFKVPQLLSSYELVLQRVSLAPPATLEYRILAYDQAEVPMSLESSVTLRSPSGAVVMSESIGSEVSRNWTFARNATPGSWMLEARVGDAVRSKQITIQEVRNITFTLENDTLTVQNFGNVPYAESISVSIGDEPKSVPVQLGVGESVRLKLFAPRGDHDVRVDGANTSSYFDRVFLTGKSVDVRNADSRSWKSMLWVWWMLAILVVAALALHFYRKFGRRASWGRTPHMDSNTHSTHHAHHTAHSMMLAAAPQGKKEECAVVAIHVKNHPLREDANSPAGQTLERITTAAVNAGAAAYTQGTWKIFIVTPAAGHPEQAAIRLARDSERIIAEHNRQYSLKLMAGIGVNKGPMIIETSEGKPKFTSVGTTVVGAKSLAERSTGEIFVSDELHRSLLGKIKVDKVNEKTWKLRKQGSVSRNAEFLKRLYERRS